MSVKVQFHFDFGSPNTYFCHRVIPTIEARTGVSFEYFPILLGGVFKATNNRSPMEAFAGIKNKSEYNALETKRFIEKYALDRYNFNPHFPVNTLQIMRGAVYSIEQGIGPQYIETMYQCMWERGMNMADAKLIEEALLEAGLPAEEILAASSNSEVKQRLIDNTQSSVDKGSFGAPTFFVGEEIFFGKNTLSDVEEEIHAQSARS